MRLELKAAPLSTAILRTRNARDPKAQRWLLCLALAGSSQLTACQKKPTQDQCNALADHLHTLLREAKVENADGAKVMMDKERDRFVMVCVREGGFKVVDCMLKAKTWAQLTSQCEPLVP